MVGPIENALRGITVRILDPTEGPAAKERVEKALPDPKLAGLSKGARSIETRRQEDMRQIASDLQKSNGEQGFEILLRELNTLKCADPGLRGNAGVGDDALKALEQRVVGIARPQIQQLKASLQRGMPLHSGQPASLLEAAKSGLNLGVTQDEVKHLVTKNHGRQLEYATLAAQCGAGLTSDALNDWTKKLKADIGSGLTSWEAVGTTPEKIMALANAPRRDSALVAPVEMAAIQMFNPFPYGLVDKSAWNALKDNVESVAKSLKLPPERLKARIAEVIAGSEDASGPYSLR